MIIDTTLTLRFELDDCDVRMLISAHGETISERALFTTQLAPLSFSELFITQREKKIHFNAYWIIMLIALSRFNCSLRLLIICCEKAFEMQFCIHFGGRQSSAASNINFNPTVLTTDCIIAFLFSFAVSSRMRSWAMCRSRHVTAIAQR